MGLVSTGALFALTVGETALAGVDDRPNLMTAKTAAPTNTTTKTTIKTTALLVRFGGGATDCIGCHMEAGGGLLVRISVCCGLVSRAGMRCVA
jgi:hypothetical protein